MSGCFLRVKAVSRHRSQRQLVCRVTFGAKNSHQRICGLCRVTENDRCRSIVPTFCYHHHVCTVWIFQFQFHRHSIGIFRDLGTESKRTYFPFRDEGTIGSIFGLFSHRCVGWYFCRLIILTSNEYQKRIRKFIN
jgi:hypothetical protein